jgi:hypothetical protein
MGTRTLGPEMTAAHQDAHNAACGLCRFQLADPQPFHDDLCHMHIGPGAEPVIQCPHIAVPGNPSKICAHHVEGAVESYARLVERTAPFN